MKKYLILIAASLVLYGCINDDHFGLSDRADIKTFVIPEQTGKAVIYNDSITIVVPIAETITDFNLTPSEIVVSNFARVSPAEGVTQDFGSPVEYVVTAEDGTQRVYRVRVERSGSQPQLQNASFEDWYTETVLLSSIEQPGVDKNSTIWGTANRGLALGGASANTTRQPITDSSYVRMESVSAPALVRIAAATIFTGKFTDGFPSVTDPRSNITLGIPFTSRPLSFTFSFKYQPGESNEDANGQPLPYGDQCDIYLFLENRDGEQVKRIATAWFRNSDEVIEWTRENIAIKYGPLDETDPWYSYAQPLEGEAWGEATDPVTHITILATSSFEGDYFNGAIGSILELDNIILGY